VGKENEQYSQLMAKSDKITNSAIKSQLNKRQAWLALAIAIYQQ
jgi:hypothetical protein